MTEAQQKLEDIINSSFSISSAAGLPDNIKEYLKEIGNKSYSHKGVYTVITALLLYKCLNPDQDIRYHQSQLKGGFSGRRFDTENVTPTLKKMGMPAMAESGWLTRSLEQAHPYDNTYTGKISGGLKEPFLKTVDYAQKHSIQCEIMLIYMFSYVKEQTNRHQIKITPLEKSNSLTIPIIINALQEHFLENYGTHNGAKLPVLAFHSIYQCIISEVQRYNDCSLQELSSLTACDKTNKTSGDIEIFKNNKVFEGIEIKLDRKIDEQIVRIAEQKIYQFNPERYYILSVKGIKEEDRDAIFTIIENVQKKHGCQIIINGLMQTLTYYLRLIKELNDFMWFYTEEVNEDRELQRVHKEKWRNILMKLQG